METSKNLLIIGGTARNIGKTTLANMIIERFSLSANIIGLKVSTHKKDEESFHGFHAIKIDSTFSIKEENCQLPEKDTAKMINNGASAAYYIETPQEKVNEAYSAFQHIYNKENKPVVCESRSLRNYVLPGLYILIIGSQSSGKKEKKLSHEELSHADIICRFEDGIAGLIETVNKIKLVNNEWKLS